MHEVTPFDAAADPVRTFTTALPDFARSAFALDQRTIPALRLLAERDVDLTALAAGLTRGLKYRRREYVAAVLRRRVLREAGLLTEEEL